MRQVIGHVIPQSADAHNAVLEDAAVVVLRQICRKRIA
jgi:hypothetical protein